MFATWEDVYTSPGLQVPWYTVAGYADWLGNATAERAFTTSSSSRWQYPSLWHSVNVLVPPNYATLQIVMVRRCFRAVGSSVRRRLLTDAHA
jgi:tartrate-resistant acid phosphatase type 5